MINDILVVGVTMLILEFLKTFKVLNSDKANLLLPVLACFLCAGLEVLNAYIFGTMLLIQALKVGFELGGYAAGVYAIGKKYMQGSTTDVNKNIGSGIDA